MTEGVTINITNGAASSADTTVTQPVAAATTQVTQEQSVRRHLPFIDLSFTNKAVGVHHTDTTDAAWDGPANEKNVRSGENEAYYRKVYAWNNPDKDPATKSAWSFIHHVVSADGTPGAADIKGCQSACGVLNGGMMAPGADAPWKGDRQGIYDHLAAHLRDAGVEPPELNPTMRAPQQRKRGSRDWYRIENAANPDSPAEVYVYDEICDPFMADVFGGVSALGFVRDLQGLRGHALNLHINSPGGDVFQGIAIYNALRAHDAPVHGYVDGIAASIASVIAMGCDDLTMMPHAMMMIHEASGMTIGPASEHQKQAEILNKLSDDIAAVYRERGDSRINWRAKMKAETWLTDAEAVSMGLADRVGEPMMPGQMPMKNRFDLSRYANVPAELLSTEDDADRDSPTKRQTEQALRDAGYSAAEAKAFVSRGWQDGGHRDDAALSADPSEQEALGESDAEEDATGTVVTAEAMNVARAARKRELEMLQMMMA